MEKSTVYFTDFRCPVGTSQLDKLKKLCVAAGIKNIDMDGKFVAIKMHFGELGNLAFLSPNYAKAVADLCKDQGGMPFLTDCNTLYPGSRKNALEHNPPFERRSRSDCVHEQVAKLGPVSRAAGMDCECPLYIFLSKLSRPQLTVIR